VEGEGEDEPAAHKFLGCGASSDGGTLRTGDGLWMTLMLAGMAVLRRRRKAGERS